MNAPKYTFALNLNDLLSVRETSKASYTYVYVQLLKTWKHDKTVNYKRLSPTIDI